MSLAVASPVSRRMRQKVSLKESAPATLDRPDLDGIVARAFGFETTDPATQASPVTNFDLAFDALRRGAASLNDLQSRCVRLQSELAASEERHRSELHEIRQGLGRWHRIAMDRSGQLQQCQEQLEAAERQSRRQAELATKEARRADAAEQRIQDLERMTLAFHDRLFGLFAVGAAASSSLEPQFEASVNH